MAIYGAVTTLKTFFSAYLHYSDVNLPPEELKIIEFACKALKSIQDFMERLDSRSRKRMNASLERVRQEIHNFERFVFSGRDFGMDETDEKLHSIMEIVKKVEAEYYKYLLLEHGGGVVSSSSSKMVGISDERSELKEALIDKFVDRTFFLLHGMAGIGKTILAREVFEDLDISEWFECRAWVTVGLERKPEEVIEAILAQLSPDAHKIATGGGGEETTARLNEVLMGKRCLIVLDDVWDTREFEDYWVRLPTAFINNISGSQLVVTTRINHLDDSRMSWAWYIFEKRLLNKRESWDLLREKAFVGCSCPPQLEDAGKMIADECDGLPLTIITIADLLSKGEESLWIDVATQRKHQLFIDAYDQISKVLYPSYKKLIDELKLCFLYMGVFPLRCEIPRNKLINLWTAEDIFDPTLKRVVLYNEYYHDLESLKCLDFCSLIMVYQRGTYFNELPIQAIRTCGLHVSWWHFCQREARKSNFFHALDCPEDALQERIKSQNRLSIHNNVLFSRKDVYNSIEENCASTAQSLLCFGPYHQYEVPICSGLKLLQRLDALNIRFYDFPLEVMELVKLRYLALTCNGNIPPSISKLQRLQYMTVHPHLSIKSSGAPSYMPMEIWDLEELKHLQVIGSDLPDFCEKTLGMLSTLLDVTISSCTVLNKLPNLKKLKIRIELSPDAADPLRCSDHISKLINLISLKCIVVNPGCNFRVVPPVTLFPVLPSSLNKLSLSGLGYPWEEMRSIALLPSLQQLKLRCNAFQGQNWEVEECGFPRLYFLLIEGIDLVKLEGAPGSFKYLKHLSIQHCYKLEEIQLLNLCKVSKIEVVDSNPRVEKSIKKGIVEGDVSSAIDISVHLSWKSTKATSFRRNALRKW